MLSSLHSHSCDDNTCHGIGSNRTLPRPHGRTQVWGLSWGQLSVYFTLAVWLWTRYLNHPEPKFAQQTNGALGCEDSSHSTYSDGTQLHHQQLVSGEIMEESYVGHTMSYTQAACMRSSKAWWIWFRLHLFFPVIFLTVWYQLLPF